jgi:ribosome-binding factor A
MNKVRKQKIESLLQREIADLILLGTIKDPRVGSHLSISQVHLSNDGSFAKVHVNTWLEHDFLEKGVDALNHAQGFLMHLLAKKLDLRLLPKLVFYMDESIPRAIELNKKIDELLKSEKLR